MKGEEDSKDGSLDVETNGRGIGACVEPLIDLAAQVIGKYVPCIDIERNQPPLDEGMLKKVRRSHHFINSFFSHS